MNKKVLLIGGAGFIGFNTTKALVEKGGVNITIADNFFRGKMDHELRALVEKTMFESFPQILQNLNLFKN